MSPPPRFRPRTTTKATTQAGGLPDDQPAQVSLAVVAADQHFRKALRS